MHRAVTWLYAEQQEDGIDQTCATHHQSTLLASVAFCSMRGGGNQLKQ